MDDKNVDQWKEELKEPKQGVKSIVGGSTKEKHGWVEVEHGLNDQGDYVWNFCSHHRAKPFPHELELVFRIIITYLDKVMPDDVKVDIFPPPADWEKKLITVVAKGIAKKWNFDEEDMAKHLPIIGERISAEIDRLAPKKRSL